MGILSQLMIGSKGKTLVTGSFSFTGNSTAYQTLELPAGVYEVSFTGRGGYGRDSPNPGLVTHPAYNQQPVGGGYAITCSAGNIGTYESGVPFPPSIALNNFYLYADYSDGNGYQLLNGGPWQPYSSSHYNQTGTIESYIFNMNQAPWFQGLNFQIIVTLQSWYGDTSTPQNGTAMTVNGLYVLIWNTGVGSSNLGTETTQIYTNDGFARTISINVPSNSCYINYSYYV